MSRKPDPFAADLDGIPDIAATSPAPTTAVAERLEILTAADLTPGGEVPQPEEEFWYWIGAFPYAPREFFSCCGIELCKRTETVVVEHGETIRTPNAGVIMRLSRTKVRAFGAALARKVFRFAMQRGATLPRFVEQQLPAAIVSVPTEEFLAVHRDERRPYSTYIPSALDRGFADFIYAVWLDEVSPAARPSNVKLPPRLTETGLVIPPPGARAVPADEMPSSWFQPAPSYLDTGKPQ